MRTSPHDSAESLGSARPRTPKPRPQPLDLPQDNRYGTFDNADNADRQPGTGAGGSRRGSRAGGTRDSTESGPLWNYVTSPHSPLIQIRDHCHQQWVAVLLTFLLLAITVYFVFGLSAPMRAERCVTPFGTLLGDSGNIGAYSNCRTSYGGDRMDHFVSSRLQRLYTGSKWHALEYARRYWIISFLLTFPSMPAPDQLMSLEAATAVNGRRGGRGSSVVPLERYTNMFLARKTLEDDATAVLLGNLTGEANNVPAQALVLNRRVAMPAPRDLVVYAKNRKTLPDAHVVVVVALRGPFSSVAAAGKDVRWYLVKNATSAGRQPLSPEARLPQSLLAKDGGAAAANAAEAEERSRAASVAAIGDKEKESDGDGAGVQYYRVYVAEQNWDNDYWRSPRSVIEEDESDAAGSGASSNATSKAARKTVMKKRSYSRVLLLHEYPKPQGFFLEDTHNNVILGWVRAPADDPTA